MLYFLILHRRSGYTVTKYGCIFERYDLKYNIIGVPGNHLMGH